MIFNSKNNCGNIRHNDTPIYRGFVVCRIIFTAFATMSHFVVLLSYVVYFKKAYEYTI